VEDEPLDSSLRQAAKEAKVGSFRETALRPADLLDIRQKLIRQLSNHQQAALFNMLTKSPTAAEYTIGTLQEAKLWWMSSDAGQMITAAQVTYPLGTVMDENLMPESEATGFCVFERPFTGAVEITTGEHTLEVDAILWFPMFLGPVNSESIAIFSFAVDPKNDAFFLGGGDWPYGMRVDARLGITDEAVIASHIEDRRLLGSIRSLAMQPKIVAVEPENIERHARKRNERAGLSADVVGYRLRRPLDAPQSMSGAETDEDEVNALNEPTPHWKHRWMVPPYWRQQPYGPGNSSRRPQLIEGHLKGPADMPFLPPKKTIWKL
jgi:hypothetical protein